MYRGLAGAEHVKSAAGTVDAPGRNVRAKSGLNKSILDQGWFEFRRQLDYKLAWNGGYLVKRAAAQHEPNLSVLPAMYRRKTARRKLFGAWSVALLKNADVVGAIND